MALNHPGAQHDLREEVFHLALVVDVVPGGVHHANHRGKRNVGIGHDNYLALLNVLKEQGMSLNAKDVGGDYSRTAMLEIDSGNLTIRAQKKVFQI